MITRKVKFPCGELFLEGILGIPEDTEPFPTVIICHPHPLFGGSMDNNVVVSVFEALVRKSLIPLKFNFRGVGESQGEFNHGIGEREDVRAAIAFVTSVKEIDSQRIGLVGYSAGAGFALPACFNDAQVKALAAISPPLDMFDFQFLKACSKPKFLLSGSEDNFTPPTQFLKFCQSLPTPKKCESIEGADHFWWGYESTVATKVAAFFNEAL